MSRVPHELALERPSKITAETVVALLRKRHAEDVFVTECKNGSSQGSHFRMDAWAMARSWANPCVSGYEVKVSRSDFLNDNKWRAYLPNCNQFSFVCPRGIILAAELPAEVGLYYVASTGAVLTTQRKPVWRDVVIPESVWRYILMCRATIGAEQAAGDRAEDWRQWLDEKKEHRKLGYRVSRAIREHVDEVESENRSLKAKHQEYDAVRATLLKLGWTEPDKEWVSNHRLHGALDKLAGAIPPWLTRDMEKIEIGLKSVREAFAELTGKKETPDER